MSRLEAHDAGVTLCLLAVFLLVGAPVGVLLGQNAVEMAVAAIAGVGLAVLHLTVVIAIQMRELHGTVRRWPR